MRRVPAEVHNEDEGVGRDVDLLACDPPLPLRLRRRRPPGGNLGQEHCRGDVLQRRDPG